MINKNPIYENFIAFQSFINFYYFLYPESLKFKISIGRFLAKDFGVKLEAKKEFKSGIEIGAWIAKTSKIDIVNNKSYMDKGILISIPFDYFLNKSKKNKASLNISEWVRDLAQKSNIGKDLYEIINDERCSP